MKIPDFSAATRTIAAAFNAKQADAEEFTERKLGDVWASAFAAGLAAGQVDTARLDKLADDRPFDGINGIDIDEATSEALHRAGIHDATEEQWREEWRIQMRVAIDAAEPDQPASARYLVVRSPGASALQLYYADAGAYSDKRTLAQRFTREEADRVAAANGGVVVEDSDGPR